MESTITHRVGKAVHSPNPNPASFSHLQYPVPSSSSSRPAFTISHGAPHSATNEKRRIKSKGYNFLSESRMKTDIHTKKWRFLPSIAGPRPHLRYAGANQLVDCITAQVTFGSHEKEETTTTTGIAAIIKTYSQTHEDIMATCTRADEEEAETQTNYSPFGIPIRGSPLYVEEYVHPGCILEENLERRRLIVAMADIKARISFAHLHYLDLCSLQTKTVMQEIIVPMSEVCPPNLLPFHILAHC